ncbi:response regulator [Sphingomonas sp. M1-B02]|uniref:response regulator n=1 Tax=Sphingomonas sp. M1-B02 TaxID=3114300 RepID=UPI00223EFC56|nr:response regulator transcription factor [Sphingomonas sp. S6-11]UZK65465.1 response regulator transcription factor [Sphingomonas sp. S6-11]
MAVEAESGGMTRQCLVVEDQESVRAWLVHALHETFPDMAVAQASNLAEARRWLDGQERGATLPFTMALIDLGLPDGSGIDLLRHIAARHPATTAIVATIYDDDAHLFDAIAAGAGGYLLKDRDAATLSTLLRRMEAGEPPLSPSIAWRMMQHFQERPRASRRDEAGLTPREVEVLTLISAGMTTTEAAQKLGLTPHTVTSYIKILYQKLNVQSRAEATLAAVERGLVAPPSPLR